MICLNKFLLAGSLSVIASMHLVASISTCDVDGSTYTVTSAVDDSTVHGTLHSCIDVAESSPSTSYTIEFANDMDISLDNEGYIYLNSGNEVLIDGGDNTINIQSLGSVDRSAFGISGGTTLSLNNISISGFATANGVIQIYSNSALDINNSTLSDNAPTDAGAVLSSYGGSTINIRNSRIINNATTDAGSVYTTLAIMRFRDSNITIENSVISNNSNFPGGGGTLDVEDSNLEVINSTFSENSVLSSGGAIHYKCSTTDVSKTLSIDRSTFHNNNSLSGGALALGIDCANANLNFDITNSTFSLNNASDLGGAIYLSQDTNIATATFDLHNNTISANTAFNGYAIYYDVNTINDSKLALTLDSCTITNHDVGAQAAVVINESNTGKAANTLIKNTILSGNNYNDLVSDGNITSNEYNLVGNFYIAGATNLGDAETDLTGITDPLLEPLADNGGPTQTHALTENSDALNAGSTSLETDQRGVNRANSGGVQDDIGAYEEVTTSLNPAIIMYLLN